MVKNLKEEVGRPSPLTSPLKGECMEKMPVLIYDAECRLCVASKRLLQRWDTKRCLCFVGRQDFVGNEMWFFDGNGVSVSGVAAFYALLPFLPMGKVISFLFRLPGINRLAVWIYQILAKNRYRWFGKISKTKE